MKGRWLKTTTAVLALLVAALFGSATAAAKATVVVGGISVEQNGLYAKLEKEFHQAYPQWTLKFETMSIDEWQKTLPLSFESGDAPDIFFIDGFDKLTLSDLLANGWVAPAAGAEKVPQSWFDRFPKNTFVNGYNMKNGVLYGIPLRDQVIYGPGYMFYNRTVLRKAGVDPSTGIPKTWSQLLDVCAKVKASGNSCFTASFDSPVQTDRWWIPFTAAAQSNDPSDNPINFQTGRFDYGNPARLRAWTLMKTMYDKGYFIPGVATTNRETSRQIFGQNQAAFYMDGAWIPSVLNGMGFTNLDYGVAPVPVPDNPPQGKLAMGLLRTTLYVSSQVRSPKAAWAVIDWLTQPDGAYAKGYVGGGYGFLAFTDNSKWVDPGNKVIQHMISIATNGYRVSEPVPLLACPDMAKSTALQDALKDTSLPVEENSVVQALVNGKDWTKTAESLAAGRQKLFEANIAAERAKGLNVSLDYFKYPSWNFNQNFDYSTYPICH